MVTALIETTVVVDLLRNYPNAITWIESQTLPQLGITPIVWMEVMGGAPTKPRRLQAAHLMQRFAMIYLVQSDLDWAMEAQMRYELSHGVGMMDCLIASASHRLNISLYTHNLKHYVPLIGGLAQKPY